MIIEDNKELLIEYVNKFPNNWSLGTEIRKLIPSNELVKKYPNDGELGQVFRNRIEDLINK
jgi:hypothetical protein